MFRLANFDDETKDDENGIYRFISSAVSTTITDCLDEYLIDPESYRIYFGMFFEGGFFEGLSRYITPDVSLVYAGDPDSRAGYGFTLAKMKRMKDKMLDQQNFYTFDVFEEKVLFCMCEVIALRDRTAAG
ncbi:MAG: hypothetical protein K6G22_09995, partial [Lachnospiraceae bacterium]|nr:hypothetical protein [Lachnospiraceae bacterium]